MMKLLVEMINWLNVLVIIYFSNIYIYISQHAQSFNDTAADPVSDTTLTFQNHPGILKIKSSLKSSGKFDLGETSP